MQSYDTINDVKIAKIIILFLGTELRFNRESGENPLQPPLLYTETKPIPLEQSGKEGGE